MSADDLTQREAPHGVVRVLVAEDDPEMQQALTDIIETTPGLDLVAVAGDADEAAARAGEAQPDVALLDVRMPAGGGLRAARLIRRCSPDTRLVAFSAYSDRATVMDMLRAGAVEYLVKGLHDDRLIEALRRSGRGGIGLPLSEMEELVLELAQALERCDTALEKERERHVEFAGELCARLGDVVTNAEKTIAEARAGVATADVVDHFEACLGVVRESIRELARAAVAPSPDGTGPVVLR